MLKIFAKNIAGNSQLLLWRLSKAHAWPTTVLVDELDAPAVSSRLASSGVTRRETTIDCARSQPATGQNLPATSRAGFKRGGAQAARCALMRFASCGFSFRRASFRS